ncbi:MAG: cytochrome c biogenesis CcdA family protein [Candidatus Dormibacteria bacterium]
MDHLSHVTLPLAFLAGLVSFLSPCVLPLVPAYLAFLGGRAGRATAVDGVVVSPPRAEVATAGAAFIGGFSVVFVVLFYAFFVALIPFRRYFPTVAGVVVIVLAFQVAGIIKIPFLMREYKVNHDAPARAGIPGGFLLGMSFASGWTPCIGPTLGAVISSASFQGTTFRGLVLVIAYCMGLGLPFMALALGIGQAAPLIRAINRRRKVVDYASAAVLLAMGLLLLFNHLTDVASWGNRVVPASWLSHFTL